MDRPLSLTLWTSVFVVSWSVYVGGALVMELVWRPVQEHLPMAQIGVACRWMGRRYRWVALGALVGAGVSGLALRPSVVPDGDAASGAGWAGWALAVCWCILAFTLALLSLVTHPGLHARTRTSMTEAERQAARQQVGRAIRHMDLVLRIDLLVALVALIPTAAVLTTGRW